MPGTSDATAPVSAGGAGGVALDAGTTSAAPGGGGGGAAGSANAIGAEPRATMMPAAAAASRCDMWVEDLSSEEIGCGRRSIRWPV